MDQGLLATFGLKGRRAVVIGAASGIGRETAVTFGRAGAALVLGDVDEAGLAETADRARAAGAEALTRRLDVRDPGAIQAFADWADAQGGVDVWANVAGVIASFEMVEADTAAFDRILDVNLKGTYWGAAAAARIMSARGRGSIINTSSTGADNPSPGLSAYSLTKAAVNMLTRTLAVEVGPKGVRVNAVAPGYTDTPMVTHRFRGPDGGIDQARKEEIFAGRAAKAALRRTGEPIDIAMAMLYLASDASSFVTGQVLRPNGGASMP